MLAAVFLSLAYTNALLPADDPAQDSAFAQLLSTLQAKYPKSKLPAAAPATEDELWSLFDQLLFAEGWNGPDINERATFKPTSYNGLHTARVELALFPAPRPRRQHADRKIDSSPLTELAVFWGSLCRNTRQTHGCTRRSFMPCSPTSSSSAAPSTCAHPSPSPTRPPQR